jgi:hypothetical protein
MRNGTSPLKHKYSYFTSEGRVTASFKLLLKALNFPLSQHDNFIEIYQKILAAGWQNKPATERYAMDINNTTADERKDIINICNNELGFNKEVLPSNKTYDGIFLLGSDLEDTIKRVDFYKKLLRENLINPNIKLFILTGDRKVSNEYGETKEAFEALLKRNEELKKIPSNELEMIKFVLSHNLPELTKYEVIYSGIDKEHIRATTASTIEKFLELYPFSAKPKTYLVISNQPFIDYQDSVIKLVMAKAAREDIQIETVGFGGFPQVDEVNNAAILLDTIAKTLGNIVELNRLEFN